MAQDVGQFTLDFIAQTPVVVQSVEAPMSSDSGLLALRQFDHRLGFTRGLTACLSDARTTPLHDLHTMVSQRIYGILAGHEDCNDHDALRHDPVFKLLAGKRPADEPLASQPTLSRMENNVPADVLPKLVAWLTDTGVEELARFYGPQGPAELTLDLDATDLPTHGHQQLTLFHGYYDQFQYFPLILSEPTTRHVFSAWLRPGTLHPTRGAVDDLLPVVQALRRRWPKVKLHLRGDSAFGNPELYQFCESHNLSYTFGLASNARLQAWTQELQEQAVAGYEQTRQKQRLFAVQDYQADSWDRLRKVIAKAECHAQGTNLRFIVTNLSAEDAAAGEFRYDQYIQRGESEHRMDELKNGLSATRMSCHRFMANFFRLILHTAAMNLLNALRNRPGIPEDLKRGQPALWRTRVIKVASRVVSTTRRVLVELAGSWPHGESLRAVLQVILRTTDARPALFKASNTTGP
jgi:hypothetical protein